LEVFATGGKDAVDIFLFVVIVVGICGYAAPFPKPVIGLLVAPFAVKDLQRLAKTIKKLI